MEEELVDILVTTYNTNEKYLRKQINSLLRQSYKNLKIYISDDNSQDKNVIKVLKEYEEKDNRIKLFLQQTNLGYNKNFEFLLKKSKNNFLISADVSLFIVISSIMAYILINKKNPSTAINCRDEK